MIRRKQVLSHLSIPFASLSFHQVSLVALHGAAFVPLTSPLRLLADHFGSLRSSLGLIWGSRGCLLLLFGLSGPPCWLSLGLLGPFSAPSVLLGGSFSSRFGSLGSPSGSPWAPSCFLAAHFSNVWCRLASTLHTTGQIRMVFLLAHGVCIDFGSKIDSTTLKIISFT